MPNGIEHTQMVQLMVANSSVTIDLLERFIMKCREVGFTDYAPIAIGNSGLSARVWEK